MLIATAHSTRSLAFYNTTTLHNVAIHAASQKVKPSTEFSITFSLDDEGERPVKLVLTPNRDLFVQDPHIQFIGGNGARRTESMKRSRHRVFRGTVLLQSAAFQWMKVGWARITIVRDGVDPLFDGAFSISGVQYDIKLESDKTTQNGTRKQRMVVQRGYQDQILETTQPAWPGMDLFKRQYTLTSDDFVDTIGDTDGCPNNREIALVGIATDCSYTTDFDSSEDLIQSLVTMVNTASEVFESAFNIALSFHNLTIQEEECPTTSSSDEPWNVNCAAGDLDFRLRAFTQWRGMLRNDQNAYWTLMTGCPTASEVGVSWVGQLCDSERSTNIVARARNQWQVFAYVSFSFPCVICTNPRCIAMSLLIRSAHTTTVIETPAPAIDNAALSQAQPVMPMVNIS